jgi:2-polyprenyl-6-methoxyphenol hydroxylase-like FAD-dependent oxidoreductase
MPEIKSQAISTSISSDSAKIYDAIVVGAGPIGLATAIGLRKRGIENILVIDQTRAFRQVGQVLDLLPNGLRALKYLDPQAWEEVKNIGMGFLNPKQSNDEKVVEKSPKNSPVWIYRNLQGEQVRSTPLGYDDWFKDYGEGRVSISWYALQTTLRNLLPQDKVKVNHRCINIQDETETGTVRVDYTSDKGETNPYAYWSNEQKHDNYQLQNSEPLTKQLEPKSLRAKLIVAADGINSTVRRLLYANSDYHAFARPEYSGFASVSCREITDIPREVEIELEEKFFQGSPIVTIGNDFRNSPCMEDPRIMLFRRGDQLGYVIHLAIALDSLQEKSESHLIDLSLEELEKACFPHALKELIRLSPAANMQHRPYHIHRATISHSSSAQIQPPWSMGRTVLLGDAAHGMPPFMAQGANQGFEDAIAIVDAIANIAENHNWDNIPAIAQAFEKYDHLRRPLMEYVQKATLTRFPMSSEQLSQEYNQKIYGARAFID